MATDKIQSKDETTEALKQEILSAVPEAKETDRAEAGLTTLSFQSLSHPERHLWIDTDLDGNLLDLEDWGFEETWDNAVASILLKTAEAAVLVARAWLTGEALENIWDGKSVVMDLHQARKTGSKAAVAASKVLKEGRSGKNRATAVGSTPSQKTSKPGNKK